MRLPERRLSSAPKAGPLRKAAHNPADREEGGCGTDRRLVKNEQKEGTNVAQSATDRLAEGLRDAIMVERRIEERAAQALAATTKSDELRPLLEEVGARTRGYRAALEAQLARRPGGSRDAEGGPSALVSLYGALNEAALAYGQLHAIAHRAFDSQGEGNTADLAEAHMRGHTAEIQQLDLGISDVAVRELDAAGAECQCTCPACGFGLCLCAPHGAKTVRQAWSETLPKPPSDGLRVRRPRADSRALAAGLRDGDRVLAIDGQEIATDLDFVVAQRAIRGHAPDGPMTLRIRRGRETEPTEINASTS